MRTFLSVLLICVVSANAQVRTGADILLSERLDLIKGKKVGIVTNHSAILKDGRHLVDALRATPGVTIIALFGPEHGIRGDAPDGRTVHDTVDAVTGVPMYSLYGKINKPTPEMLKGVQVLLFDIQDVGARFYTFESTLSLAMEAAAENSIPYIVLDRPNPIRGTWTEGFVRDDSLASFVGLHPIPIAHGLTVGELASMINGQGWLKGSVKADLTVLKCTGWKRDQWYDETGLTWVRPSPNMATLQTAIVYPGTCLFEGTNLSEGRGTQRPFETIGAPFITGGEWATLLNGSVLPGVVFKATTFTPEEIAHVASNPKHKGVACEGVTVNVIDRKAFEPVRTAVTMLMTAKKLAGNDFQWRRSSIDRLAGTPRLRMMIDEGRSVETIVAAWERELAVFNAIRAKYLLY